MKNASIPIVEITSIDNAKLGFTSSMNVEPVLHEVQYALIKLLDSKQSSVIDLSSMPFAPGEKQQIKQLLGKGEVEILLNVMGKSSILETSYPCVWWIEHYNQDQQITGTYIEIAIIPEIIQSVTEDISSGLQRLTQTLSKRSESYENK